MIYTCDSCLFTFRRAGKLEDCPDCGKPALSEATDKEKDLGTARCSAMTSYSGPFPSSISFSTEKFSTVQI